jgi:ABC-2 type transport system permease protein
MSTFRAALRYEFRMQARKRSVWLVPLLSALLFVLIGGSLMRDLFDPEEARTTAKAAAIDLGIQLNALLTIGFGCLLADRIVRDDRLRVTPVLDATPAGHGSRLAGKYLGTAAATAIPNVLLYLALTVAWTVYWGQPSALGWALLTFALVMLPGLLFVAAFALTLPLVMPAPLFRVLFVGYWLWGNILPADLMPTLAGTVVQPVGGYPANTILDHHGGEGDLDRSGPVAGAAFNFLRPEATAAAGWLSIAVLLALAVAVLAGGQALRERRAA